MKSKKLRMAWVSLNIFCYFMLIGVVLFVGFNVEGMADINRLSIWILMILCLLFVSVFGSVQLWSWIKNGKL
jgi:hypothetical protein